MGGSVAHDQTFVPSIFGTAVLKDVPCIGGAEYACYAPEFAALPPPFRAEYMLLVTYSTVMISSRSAARSFCLLALDLAIDLRDGN